MPDLRKHRKILLIRLFLLLLYSTFLILTLLFRMWWGTAIVGVVLGQEIVMTYLTFRDIKTGRRK